MAENEHSTEQYKDQIVDVDFKYINLQYLQSISGGNKEHEKETTQQFIEILQHDLLLLKEAYKKNQILKIKHVAHHMKAVILVMDLNKILSQYLDAIEFEKLEETYLKIIVAKINLVCENAILEAKIFLKTFE